MFCPKCRAEYKQDIKRCPDCQVRLVETLAPEPKMEYVEFESVFKTANPSIIQIVKSVLDDAEIIYAIKGQGLQKIMALGVVQFQVPSEMAAAARELLLDLADDEEAEIIY